MPSDRIKQLPRRLGREDWDRGDSRAARSP